MSTKVLPIAFSILALVAGLSTSLSMPTARSWTTDRVSDLLLANRGLYLWRTGKAPGCNAWQAARGTVATSRFRRTMLDLQTSTRLIRKEGRFGLCQTDKYGDWWIVAANCLLEPAIQGAEQEIGIYGRGSAGPRPGDIVLDCGANVGVYARMTALAAGAKLVVAIEPAPDNLECLRRNLASQIAAGTVILYPKAVWNSEGSMALHISPDDSGGDTLIRRYPGDREIQVPLTTIDRIVEDLNLPRVDFIKLDIEGAERQALAGASRTLARWRPRIAVAAYHLPDDNTAIPRVIWKSRADYQMQVQYCRDYGASMKPETWLFH